MIYQCNFWENTQFKVFTLLSVSPKRSEKVHTYILETLKLELIISLTDTFWSTDIDSD